MQINWAIHKNADWKSILLEACLYRVFCLQEETQLPEEVRQSVPRCWANAHSPRWPQDARPRGKYLCIRFCPFLGSEKRTTNIRSRDVERKENPCRLITVFESAHPQRKGMYDIFFLRVAILNPRPGEEWLRRESAGMTAASNLVRRTRGLGCNSQHNAVIKHNWLHLVLH